MVRLVRNLSRVADHGLAPYHSANNGRIHKSPQIDLLHPLNLVVWVHNEVFYLYGRFWSRSWPFREVSFAAVCSTTYNWSALNRRWQTDSAGWSWWEKDRWSGRGGLALSHLDDRSSWKAKFEPKFFFGGAFPSLKVEQRPWFSAQTFLNYRSFTSRKQIAERLAETLKFWRNSRRVAAIVGKSCQPCWIIM